MPRFFRSDSPGEWLTQSRLSLFGLVAALLLITLFISARRPASLPPTALVVSRFSNSPSGYAVPVWKLSNSLPYSIECHLDLVPQHIPANWKSLTPSSLRISDPLLAKYGLIGALERVTLSPYASIEHVTDIRLLALDTNLPVTLD